MPSWLLLTHLVATAWLAGLVWTVQLVVYPAFLVVGPTDRWPEYHRRHTTGITWAVAPAWAAQGVTCAVLLLRDPGPLTLAAAALGAATVVLTLAQQVPLHQRLAGGWDPACAQRLLRTNRYRVAVWSAAVGVAAVLAR